MGPPDVTPELGFCRRTIPVAGRRLASCHDARSTLDTRRSPASVTLVHKQESVP